MNKEILNWDETMKKEFFNYCELLGIKLSSEQKKYIENNGKYAMPHRQTGRTFLLCLILLFYFDKVYGVEEIRLLYKEGKMDIYVVKEIDRKISTKEIYSPDPFEGTTLRNFNNLKETLMNMFNKHLKIESSNIYFKESFSDSLIISKEV